MDKIDEQILTLLKDNSRAHYQDIAKKLSVTEGTIRYRVAKLVDDGTIERFTIRCKDATSALMMIKLDTSVRTAEFARVMKKTDKISYIYHVTGEDSIICHVETDNLEQLDNIIEKIRAQNGVLRTKTINILKKY